MPLEGEFVVRLHCSGNRVQQVTLHSSRPYAAAGMLAGKQAREVVATMPLLFSICGRSQRAAAASALAAAGAPDESCSAARDEVGVILETVQEYFWRLLIDWPAAMGKQPLLSPVAVARREIAAAPRGPDGVLTWGDAAVRELGESLAGLATTSLYAVSPVQWLGLGESDALDTWIDRGATLPAVLLGELMRHMPEVGRSDVSLMPTAAPEALLGAVVPAMCEPRFAQAPTWNGVPVETGALPRMRTQPLVAAVAERHGNAVVTRMVARLTELAVLLQVLAAAAGAEQAGSPIQALSLASGEGLSAVQTARGLLLHRARLADGRVADYQIVAPTEWNFHPDGALVHGLTGLAAADEGALEQRTRLAVQALDPCVGYRIEVGHA